MVQYMIHSEISFHCRVAAMEHQHVVGEAYCFDCQCMDVCVLTLPRQVISVTQVLLCSMR